MEAFLTATILSGVVYDIVKTSAKLTLDNFKTKVKGWLIDDTTAQKVVDEINQIDNIHEQQPPTPGFNQMADLFENNLRNSKGEDLPVAQELKKAGTLTL